VDEADAAEVVTAVDDVLMSDETELDVFFVEAEDDAEDKTEDEAEGEAEDEAEVVLEAEVAFVGARE
jgi:hypothetical protein